MEEEGRWSLEAWTTTMRGGGGGRRRRRFGDVRRGGNSVGALCSSLCLGRCFGLFRDLKRDYCMIIDVN